VLAQVLYLDGIFADEDTGEEVRQVRPRSRCKRGQIEV
jgi:hypothetical protein